MKKLFLISTIALSMSLVSCNNEPKENDMPIEDAMEDMQDALVEDTNVVAEEVTVETTEEAH